MSELSGTIAALELDLRDVRMNVPDHEIVAEAVARGYAGEKKQKTVEKYEKHLDHYVSYLHSVRGKTLYTAKRADVEMFMGHLKRHGGGNPHPLRLNCSWCRDRGYPDGRQGCGWSSSTRKGYHSALVFIYDFFCMEEDLPSLDPVSHLPAPMPDEPHTYTPSKEEVMKLLDAPGKPANRLLVHFMFYAPSRLDTFVKARWSDIDFDHNTWTVVGKKDKRDTFHLNSVLVRELRHFRAHQERVALTNRAVRDALAGAGTDYIFMTRSGRRQAQTALPKMLKRHAIRAGVGVVAAKGKHDAVGGRTSRVCPHSLRRAWATIALNDPRKPVPIDVVSKVLGHEDISTTRRHYARTKPERARDALLEMRLY